jgi:hypothetical protein
MGLPEVRDTAAEGPSSRASADAVPRSRPATGEPTSPSESIIELHVAAARPNGPGTAEEAPTRTQATEPSRRRLPFPILLRSRRPEGCCPRGRESRCPAGSAPYTRPARAGDSRDTPVPAHASPARLFFSSSSRTSCSIAWAASTGSPCSQILTADSPPPRAGLSVSRSRVSDPVGALVARPVDRLSAEVHHLRHAREPLVRFRTGRHSGTNEGIASRLRLEADGQPAGRVVDHLGADLVDVGDQFRREDVACRASGDHTSCT